MEFIRRMLFSSGGNNSGGGSGNTDLVQIAHKIVLYSDFQPNGTTDGTILVIDLPAGAIPISFKIKTSQAFSLGAGSGIYVNLSLQNSNGSALYNGSPLDLTSTVSPTKGQFGHCTGESIIPSHTAISSLNAALSVGDDSGLLTINDLVAGTLDIWIWYVISI